MNNRSLSLASLMVALLAIAYAAWLHSRVEAMAYEALRRRESELVRHWAPKMEPIYAEMLAGTARTTGNPETLEELFEPLVSLIDSLGDMPDPTPRGGPEAP